MPLRKSTRRPIRRRRLRRRTIAPSVKKYISSALSKNIETKKKATVWSEQTLSSATYRIKYQDAFMNLQQGANNATQTGNWVNGVGVALKFALHNNGAEPMCIRFLALINKQGAANTSYQTGYNLFEGDSGNVSLTSITDNSHLWRRINQDQYKVVTDRVYTLSGTADKDRFKIIKKWYPLHKRRINIDGSQVTPTTNQLIFLWLCGEADDDSTDVVVEYAGSIDFYYKDA